MSKTEHTPGAHVPRTIRNAWEVFKTNDPKINPEIWSKYKRVAIIHDVETARLFVQSPTMYDLIVERIALDESDNQGTKEWCDAVDRNHFGMVAAIAKAKGE